MRSIWRTIVGVWRFLVAVVKGFSDHDVMGLAAAVAFYTLLSFAPLVLLIVMVGGLLGEVAQNDLVKVFYTHFGPRASEVGEAIVSHARNAGRHTESWRWALSTGMLVLSASLVFGQLQNALNRIWGADQVKIRGGFFGWIWKRVLSLGMVVAMMFIMLVAMVVSTIVEMLVPRLGGNPTFSQAGVVIVSLIVTTLFSAIIFKVLPDAKIAWREVWLGAFTTAVLFAVGKLGVAYYLKFGGVANSYGQAAGALIAMLVWVYYSCVILFIGAEMTAQFDQRGARIRARRAEAQKAAAAQVDRRPGLAATGSPPPGDPPEQRETRESPETTSRRST